MVYFKPKPYVFKQNITKSLPKLLLFGGIEAKNLRERQIKFEDTLKQLLIEIMDSINQVYPDIRYTISVQVKTPNEIQIQLKIKELHASSMENMADYPINYYNAQKGIRFEIFKKLKQMQMKSGLFGFKTPESSPDYESLYFAMFLPDTFDGFTTIDFITSLEVNISEWFGGKGRGDSIVWQSSIESLFRFHKPNTFLFYI